ncbi:toxin-antitoxin system HicB family antitoxin [Ottowia testudinis]|uniref:Toxin-antitoxin system HicB family antitoxin n=1 Tax=Ottowia testudinis TaxID=2816950 RepID=A0A975CE52_9BURK|nr:toxin-antitoxin system HicB family antitoxin [Ottowia testudinis]QTD44575.1 toxin-antitoxin system HicB family antitoxin [Ottowia testudinis]
MTELEKNWVRMTLRLPDVLRDRAKAKADAQHISLNSFIVQAVARRVSAPASQQPKGQP